MDPQAHEHADPELDALLRSRRPLPDPSWVAATERRLLPGQRRRFALRPTRALRLGVALAVALAGPRARALAGRWRPAGRRQHRRCSR